MQHSGRFDLTLAPDPALDPAAIPALWQVAETFAAAVSLELFGKSKVHAQAHGTSDVQYTLDADNVPEYAFRVLNGMLHYFQEVTGPLASWVAYSSARPGYNLFGTAEPLPAPLTQYPLPATLDIDFETDTPPLYVEVNFAATPPPEMQQQLIDELMVWHRLMQGGYPIEDNEPGESGTSQPSVRFEGPNVLRYHVDMWQTAEEAFVPLFNLLWRWDQYLAAIASVEIGS